MTKHKIFSSFCILLFCCVFAYSHKAVASTDNSLPAYDTGVSMSNQPCSDSEGIEICFFDILISNPVDYVAYSGSITTTIDEAFGGSNAIIQMCITENGWGTDSIYCDTPFSGTVTAGMTLGPFNKGLSQDASMYLEDMNYVSFRIQVDHANSRSSLTAYGRTAHINYFNPSFYTLTPNQQFALNWQSANTVDHASISWSGANLSCNVANGASVSVSGSTTCTSNEAGTTTFVLHGFGYGQADAASIPPREVLATFQVTTSNAPPPPAAWSNEPAGFNVLTDMNLDSLSGSGWGISNPSGNVGVIADATAPLSPSNVGRWRYPSGFSGGDAPGNMYYPLPANFNEGYIGTWWKPNAGWEGHSNGENVIYIIFGHGCGISMTMTMYADGGNPPFKLRVGPQWDSLGWLLPNVNDTAVSLGVWHKIEFYFKYDTNGNNGIIRWWMDGSLIGDYTNINFPSSSCFDEFGLYPIWGAVGTNKTQTDNFRFDHIRMSRPSGGAAAVVNSDTPTSWTLTGPSTFQGYYPSTTATYDGIPSGDYTVSAQTLNGFAGPVYSPATSGTQSVPNGSTTIYNIHYLAHPQSFSADTNTECTKARLSWNDGANETYYRIFRATSPGGPFNQVGSDLPANTVTYTDTTGTPNSTYYYYVSAVNTHLTANSNTLQVFILQCQANLSNSSITLREVNGESYVQGMEIEDGDVLRFRIIINNGSVATVGAIIDNITSNLTSNLVDPRDARVDKGSGFTNVTISGTAPNITIPVTGNMPPGTIWIVEFIVTVDLDETSVMSNSALINCSSEISGVNCSTVKKFLMLLVDASGTVKFREVSP